MSLDYGEEIKDVSERLEVINIEGDDYEDKSEGTFDLEEPLNPASELPDAHGTPSKRDKDAQNASLKQRTIQEMLRKEEEENEAPVLFDFKSPMSSQPLGIRQESGPTTYVISDDERIEREDIDPDSLSEKENEEKDNGKNKRGDSKKISLNAENDEKDEEDTTKSYSEMSSSSAGNTGCKIQSSDVSSIDQKSGTSFFINLDGAKTEEEDEDQTSSSYISPPPLPQKRLKPTMMRRRTKTLDDRMTQSVHEDRRSIESQSSMSFYVDFSASPAPKSKPLKKSIPSFSAKTPPPPPTVKNSLKITKKPMKKKPPPEDNFETVKFFFKKLLKRVEELTFSPGQDDIQQIKRKRKLADRILDFIDEEESKVDKGERLTLESKIDEALLSEIKKPTLRRERTFDLDSGSAKKMSLFSVEIETKSSPKENKNLKFYQQQKAFFVRRIKREISKLDKRIHELESKNSVQKNSSRKQCWPMPERELQIVENVRPRRRLPAPAYPAPRLPARKVQANRMTQSLIEESSIGKSTSFVEIAAKRASRDKIRINVKEGGSPTPMMSPSLSWYLNDSIPSFPDDDEEEEYDDGEEIVWFRRESPRQYYYDDRPYRPYRSPPSYPTYQRRSRFSDNEEYRGSLLYDSPSFSGSRRSVNNFGQTFPSPNRKSSDSLMSCSLTVRKTKNSIAKTDLSSPISSRNVQTRSALISQWDTKRKKEEIDSRREGEYRRTEYIDLETDEYVMESRRKLRSPSIKKHTFSKIPKTKSPYETAPTKKMSNKSKSKAVVKPKASSKNISHKAL